MALKKSAFTEIAKAATKLGRKQEEAIAALLSHRTIDDAARACNKRARTLYRWLKEPVFFAAYREARRTAVSQATARLQQASSVAVSTLLKVMVDQTAPASARVRAADSVLAHTAKAIELEDLAERLIALEQAGEAQKQDERERLSFAKTVNDGCLE
jgi:hypothetical protein